nr:cytochrome P450 [Rubidibacter lacunae]
MNTTTSAASLPPGTLGLPFIGETLAFLRDRNFARDRAARYGPIFKTHLLGRPTVFVCSEEGCRFVLANESKYFVVSWPPSTRKLLGSLSLALQTGGVHYQRRRILAQAFQPRALAGYIETMDAICCSFIERWLQVRSLAWYPELRQLTFDIACKLFVGMDSGSHNELGEQFELWCQGLFTLPLNFPWTRFGRARRNRDWLLQQLEEIIRKRQESDDPGDDALGLLVRSRDEDGSQLGLDELKDQVLLLLFAGHETLTSSLVSFCLLVGQHPDVRDRLLAELDRLPDDAPLTLESLQQLTYLEQVLQEVMRCIPPVGGGFRTVIQECELDGYRLPEGWGVIYQIAQLHMNPDRYPDPDRFDPDRFAPGSDNPSQTYSYAPFGGGLRECLGKEFARLEMKIVAVRVLQACDWTITPDQDLSLVVIPSPRPRDGLRVVMRDRRSAG